MYKSSKSLIRNISKWSYSSGLRSSTFLKERRHYSNDKSKSQSSKKYNGQWKFPFFMGQIVVVILSTIDCSSFFPVAHMKNQKNGNNFIADVVEKTAEAVVMVEILSRNFFSGAMTPQSNGSGFIISEDGLILTSAHVVLGGRLAGSLNVKLQDGTNFRAHVENVDMKADLATIRVKANRRLPVIPLGSDPDLRPGEWVVAIGCPLSLSNTITAGVVSTVHRSSLELKLVDKENMTYIQTDASLTFGNSGGPLVNLDGEVIGVNAMKVAPGISFAVPIHYARDLIKQTRPKSGGGRGISMLLSDSNPHRYIGVSMLTLTKPIIGEINGQTNASVGVEEGVLLWRIADDSPASIAGLRPGDIAVEINGKKVTNTGSIYEVLESEVEKPIRLTVARNEKLIQFNVKPIKLEG